MGGCLVLAEKDSKLFMLAVEMSYDGIVIGDVKGNITYVNESILRMFGSNDKNDISW